MNDMPVTLSSSCCPRDQLHPLSWSLSHNFPFCVFLRYMLSLLPSLIPVTHLRRYPVLTALMSQRWLQRLCRRHYDHDGSRALRSDRSSGDATSPLLACPQRHTTEVRVNFHDVRALVAELSERLVPHPLDATALVSELLLSWLALKHVR